MITRPVSQGYKICKSRCNIQHHKVKKKYQNLLSPGYKVKVIKVYIFIPQLLESIIELIILIFQEKTWINIRQIQVIKENTTIVYTNTYIKVTHGIILEEKKNYIALLHNSRASASTSYL